MSGSLTIEAQQGRASEVPVDLLVAGGWLPSRTGRRFAVENPATGETIAEVANADEEDAVLAVRAASEAQGGWANTPPRERGEILRAAYEILTERTEHLALLMTMEMGKPLAESRGEVAYAADFFRWFAEEAVRIDGGYASRPDGRARTITVKQPVGPCLLITPWNFPLAMGTRKLGPAIAAGCTSVLKPAQLTPLSSLALAAILQEAGLPAGVVNVVTSTTSGDVVSAMLGEGTLRKLSFTGSTAVGKHLLRSAADGVLRTSMELGGNAPFLVLEDADIDLAVDAALAAKMRNMGEACTAANRFFVHESISQEFATQLAGRMAELRVGDGRDEGTQVGPLIDGRSRDTVMSLVDDAVSRGADVLTGGSSVPGAGYFMQPTVLAAVAHDSDLVREEIFGPVAAVQSYTDLDEVLERANDSEVGLAGYVIGQDLHAVLHVAERLEVGMVGINTGIISNASAPFGGIKQSGLGREGGRVGIEEYLETKYISIPLVPQR